MPGKILLKNARIVNEGEEFEGSLLLDNGIIEHIFKKDDTPDSDHIHSIDLSGLILLPGVIDDQVHFREPGFTHKGNLASESRAAVAGGITSFMEMPNTSPQTITQKDLEDKFKLASENSFANYSFYMGATNDNIDQLIATDPGHVCGIKVFMGASTGNMLVDNPKSLSDIFRIKRLPIAVHCEDETTIRQNLETEKAYSGNNIAMARHPYIRSREACLISSRLAISLAERYQTRLHLLHISTEDEIRLLDNKTPLKDKRITAEVCVHHLWFSSRDYGKKGSFIKWNPAIKEEKDRKALVEALRNGYFDVVATDHAPHTLEEKSRVYTDCPSGAPMVQHSLIVMLEFVHQGLLSLADIARLMCHNPAICFGVKNRGFIRQGYAADLVAVDMHSSHTVERSSLYYACGWSPLEGSRLQSRVVYTFVNGVPVFENGKWNDNTKGHALEFSR